MTSVRSRQSRAGKGRLLAYFLMLAATSLLHSEALASGKIFRIATASKAGTFYPIGSLIARGISAEKDCSGGPECGVPGLIAIAQVSNGSVANVEAVSVGDIEAGLAQADVIYWAYTGTGRFKKHGPYAGFKAVQDGNVWSYNKRVNANFGNDFFEGGVANPQLVLGDLIAIFHPDLLPEHEFVYYQPVGGE